MHLRTKCPYDPAMALQIASFRSLIELWGSREAMASDIGAGASTVSKWWQRDSVPAEWWSVILATDKAVSAEVDAEALTILAARHTIQCDAPAHPTEPERQAS